ncbi:MAG: Fe-S cluster assembly ATPase SufC [Candidatus Pacebacteria bacterium CG10_big_fil_rev_8_21_14_0_10_36_11]|nr:Fe-S cluster assembly ATPase SufC [Candidatus Pacearchaeota archaeon]OIP73746.1 MAG: Fe-S cluster assembly ATPase SufC [Candidatus Pacebacteria bacterium CG2_30_36_39]PIR64668.1 MAG: Fe-S cluster assembly ATPase SufC [Candidatus Pacebacteria bacterium CG10_big_fil_rev_8_21_14_0_10_36_11]PJC42737.1 MAG: Fe-S cluster assembly ATPase SufC [Candidatus Pacebacteria bacterium CG_4_9_14_0_2_um_filter_36_8]
MSFFSVKDLRASTDGQEILQGINLDIEEGKTVVVMGPNGSGKSTLSNVLAGHPDYQATGSAILAGKELLNMSPDERAREGLFLAFQYPVEIPGVKVLNFLWTVYTQKYPDRSKRKYVSIVEFRDFLFEKATELDIAKKLLDRGLNEGFSGGEKKRLEILQMAVLEPKLAILDETDSGLDIDAIRIVARGVAALKKQLNMTVIVITHYQRILQYLTYDEVLIVSSGRVVKTGGPELVAELEKTGYGQIRS